MGLVTSHAQEIQRASTQIHTFDEWLAAVTWQPAKKSWRCSDEQFIKQALVDTQRQMEQTRQKINQITQAQNQTRENMKAIAPQAQASDYYNRLLKRMSDQDTQLDTQQKALDDQQQQLNARQKELEDYLNNLNVG